MPMTGHFEPIARSRSAALPMPSTYFSSILRDWGRTPTLRTELLAGITDSLQTPESSESITLGQQLQQVDNACRLLEPDWALSTGARLDLRTHGPLGVAAFSAATLRDTLLVLARFGQLRSPHFRMPVVMAGDEVRLLPQDRVPLRDAERSALLDIVLMCTQNFVESALGHAMEGARIELPQPAPKHAECYPKLFHAPVRFDCAEAAVVLPARWAALRNPYADPSLYEASVRGLHENAQQLHAGQLLVARVEQLLTRRGTSLSRSSAARLLGVSSRTLTRRLQDEGTSYFALLEQSRRAQADALLRDPELSVAEIGHVLGYRDTANFGRAFRRWFDVSPSAYRKRLARHPHSRE